MARELWALIDAQVSGDLREIDYVGRSWEVILFGPAPGLITLGAEVGFVEAGAQNRRYPALPERAHHGWPPLKVRSFVRETGGVPQRPALTAYQQHRLPPAGLVAHGGARDRERAVDLPVA